eukprot:3259671-Pleurochrysis_carterae.AAC.2
MRRRRKTPLPSSFGQRSKFTQVIKRTFCAALRQNTSNMHRRTTAQTRVKQAATRTGCACNG